MALPLFERFRKIEMPSVPFLSEGTTAYMMGECSILVAVDSGRRHLSIAHPHRYPTWEEIKEAREYLLPIAGWFCMIMPPPQHYVNSHKNCFHLWEMKDEEGLMTTRCIFCGKDNDDGAGVIRAVVFVAIGLATAIGLFQLFSWFRWLCGWGG